MSRFCISVLNPGLFPALRFTIIITYHPHHRKLHLKPHHISSSSSPSSSASSSEGYVPSESLAPESL
eukprot:8926875-Pyramimonas_sp.AAC.1